MSKMTYDLEKVEEVCRAATPGPWELIIYTGALMDMHMIQSGPLNVCEIITIREEKNANADFIALARTALPELCARIRELAEQLT
jgi:hypothetical protein